MDQASIIEALRQKGNDAAQFVGNAARGYFGFEPSADATGAGNEAYRNFQALSMAPLIGMPAGVVKGAGNVVQILRKSAKAGKAVEPVVTEAAQVMKLNPAETNARAAIEELLKQSKAFGIDAGGFSKDVPVGSIMSDLDYFYGLNPAVAALPETQKARLRELWYRAEDAAMAMKRADGKDALMGKK